MSFVLIWNAEFDMLSPGMMESSITVGQSVFSGNFAAWEKSVDHYTPHRTRLIDLQYVDAVGVNSGCGRALIVDAANNIVLMLDGISANATGIVRTHAVSGGSLISCN